MATAIRGEEELTNTFFNKRQPNDINTIMLPLLFGDPVMVSTTWSPCLKEVKYKMESYTIMTMSSSQVLNIVALRDHERILTSKIRWEYHVSQVNSCSK